MKLAIVGSGISGLSCALRLHGSHDVTLFESRSRLGGHTATIDAPVGHGGATIAVDTGFIVFNERNYPGFVAMLAELGVASAPSTMSFSVRDDARRLEYGGSTFGGIFAQRRNLLRPRHLRMLRDIKRFGPVVRSAASRADEHRTLGAFLDEAKLSRGFVEDYLVPMAAAIWSAPPTEIYAFPLRAFVQFFDTHGMLEPWEPPQWRYVVGGSRTYVDAIASRLGDRVRLSDPVRSVRRTPVGVEIVDAAGASHPYDEVIIATHSDQALAMLESPSETERAVLGGIPYRSNDVVLHTDRSLLPRREAAWAAWNYHAPADTGAPVTVTYLMNTLQCLDAPEPVCVTLNTTDAIDPGRIIGRYQYDHPSYGAGTFESQRRWAEISGVDRIHYCGAYWGYGFHEDGVRSASRVCERIGALV